MPEETLFESERVQSREEIADAIERVADGLRAGEPITFSAGDDSVTVDPPDRPTFELEVEREGPADGPGEVSVELEIEWDEDDADGPLEVE